MRVGGHVVWYEGVTVGWYGMRVEVHEGVWA